MSLEIKQCILTKNRCYKQGKKIVPKGIIVHSTGANNPNLKRYVQPDDGILGKNSFANHWNTSIPSKCVHAFIGKDKNGVVRVYQTLPWDYRCWGCASGKKGTYNDSYIQFEICEDALTDAKYFNEAFSLAIELCAYLAKKYNIPNTNIISHNEAYKRGYASNHGDCDHWLKRFGRNMDWFRGQVASNNVEIIIQNPISSSFPSVNFCLMKGDKGEDVKQLQENLNYMCYFCGKADGDFGTKTEDALKKFQKDYALTTDGKYGETSKRMLENAVANKKNVPTTSSNSKFVYNNYDYSLVFDPTYYSNAYSDLKRHFGNDSKKLFEHFIENGRVEGRQAIKSFNPVVYKNRYPDLQQAFGDNMPSYYNHYIQFGHKENRKGI